MKLLISGATGFIGQELIEKLLDEGHEIWALTRNKEKAQKYYPYPVDFLTWKELDELDKLPEWNGVIHLAGEPIANKRWTKTQKEKLYHSRITTGKSIIEAIERKQISIDFFFTSSGIGIYGDQGDQTLNESSPVADDYLAKLCTDWENFTKPLQQKGVRCCQLRTGIVLGTNEGALKKLVDLCQLGLLSPLGDGKQYMSWIHIEDWVNALLFIMKNNEISGPVNFVNPHPLPNKLFMQYLAQHFNKWLLPNAPTLILKLVLGKMSQILLDSQKVQPQVLQKNHFSFKYSNLQESLLNLYPNPERGLIIKKKLFIPEETAKAFSFFTDPYNLEKVSPPFLKLKILESSDKKIQTGSIIKYRLTIMGITLKWKTKILDLKENSYFVDTQEKGPYKTWLHTHSFVAHKRGTLLIDTVHYRLGFGILNHWLSLFFAAKTIEKVFLFRTQAMKKIFYK